jgi:hypothetical protein
MCDYSLGGLPNRLAVEGEELIVHKFPTGSMGLAAPADLPTIEANGRLERPKTLWQTIKSFLELSPNSPPVPAVCVPPGASLVLKNVPADLRREWNIEEGEGVRFVQISANVNAYRDALQLPNGRQVLLQEIRQGMRLQVVSWGGTDAEVEEIPHQMVTR